MVELDPECRIHLRNILLQVRRHTITATRKVIQNQQVTCGVGQYTVRIKRPSPATSPSEKRHLRQAALLVTDAQATVVVASVLASVEGAGDPEMESTE